MKRIEFILVSQLDLGFKEALRLSYAYRNVINLGCEYDEKIMEKIEKYSRKLVNV